MKRLLHCKELEKVQVIIKYAFCDIKIWALFSLFSYFTTILFLLQMLKPNTIYIYIFKVMFQLRLQVKAPTLHQGNWGNGVLVLAFCLPLETVFYMYLEIPALSINSQLIFNAFQDNPYHSNVAHLPYLYLALFRTSHFLIRLTNLILNICLIF